MTNGLAPGQEYQKLKELLFHQEQQTLQEVKELVIGHHERAGSRERFQKSMAEVMPDALRDAHAMQRDGLTIALSPVVLAGLKRELEHSPGEIIDAFRPLMGRLILAYAARRLRDFTEGLNSRLAGLLSGRFLRLRLRSLVTGIPYARLLAAQTEQFRIDALFLIRRGSGILVDHWLAGPDRDAPYNGNGEHLTSPLVPAITEFARDAFSHGHRDMETLDLGDSVIYLRASPDYLLAAKCAGARTRRLEHRLDAEMNTILEQHAGALAQAEKVICGNVSRAVLPALAERLRRVLAGERPRPVLAIAFLTILLLASAAWIGSHILAGMRARALEEQAAAAIAGMDELRGFPIRVSLSPGRDIAVLSGLVPSEEAGRQAASRVAGVVQPIQLRVELTPVASAASIAALTAQSAALRQQLDERSSPIMTGPDQNRPSLQPAGTTQEAPDLKLTMWVRRHAIFFVEQTKFRDPSEAGRQLDELRDLLLASGMKIRVAGYTDPAGTAETNGSLALARASHVIGELTRRGVPGDQLKAIGRPNGIRLSQDKGAGSNNRRVEFEPLFEGEAFKDPGVPVASTGRRRE